MKSLKLFYSYSHRDEELREQLETHLALLRRQGFIEAWHDRRISPGEDWKGAIDTNLTTADLVLLLVSADFLASDYCYDTEMKSALSLAERGSVLTIPVILRPVEWSDAPFSHLQALPKNGKPITTWSDRDAAFADVASGIKEAIELRREVTAVAAAERQRQELATLAGSSDFERQATTHTPPTSLGGNQFLFELAHALAGQRTEGVMEEGQGYTVDLAHIPLKGFTKPIVIRQVSSGEAHIQAPNRTTHLGQVTVLVCLDDVSHREALATAPVRGCVSSRWKKRATL